MSLLNTFAILFETNAKDAAEDVEQLSDELDDTAGAAGGAADGLDDVAQSADSGAISIGGLTGTILKLGAAYVSLDFLASGVMENALAIDEVGKFSQTLGENIVEIDAWGEAVARNGGSAEAFRGSVESLNTSLSDIKLTGGGEVVNTLAMLGVTATGSGGKIRSAFDVLPEIADAFQRLSAQESFSFGRRLGLDQGTILLLQQGRVAVEDLVERQKLLGGVTREGYEAAAAFNDQWDDSKRIFNSLFVSANTTILPMLTKVLSLLEDGVMWIRQNQELVEGFFIGVAGVITAIYLPAIASAAAATVAAAAPFVAIGAAIGAVGAAIAILYEDFIAWTEGSSSLLGDLLGDFEDFKESIFSVIDAITRKWDEMIDWFSETGESIGSFFDDLFGDSEVSATQSNTSNATNTMRIYGTNPLNTGGYSAYNTNRTTVNNIEVGGATIDARGMSPQQARQAFSGGLKDNVEMALGQLDDGVDR